MISSCVVKDECKMLKMMKRDSVSITSQLFKCIKSPDSFSPPFLLSCVVTSSPRLQMDFLTVSTSLARSDAFTLSRVSWASCCSLFSLRGAKNGPISSDVGSKIVTDVIIEKESHRFLVERRNKLSISCSAAQNFNRCSQLRSAKMNR